MTRTSTMPDSAWRKSSHSMPNGGECLEVLDLIPGTVPVRDSKRPRGAILAIPVPAWAAFIAALQGQP
ncbi:DUF397 domain-containing protein [Streptoverticillium reticulum]|uniref:DUF397 domain-containing protein n=1 Tax=Streptoverticillium reticulum TaxID=1433415 RepID=UPI0039BFC490